MHRFLLIMVLFSSINLSAQLTIGPGSQLYISGNTQLTLNDQSLINNGNFTAGTGSVYFTGSSVTTISGSQPSQFYRIQVNKTAASLSLQRSIAVSNEVFFQQGLFDLNGNDLDLGNSGFLTGESAGNRIVGSLGGEVIFNASMNAPSNANPANLGAIISSSQNLGNVTIRRGQTNHSISGTNSVLRYYRISPTNNSGLNATLRFHYFDTELNNLVENNLVYWRSQDGLAWTQQGFTSRDITQNYVEKTGIDAFSFWILSVPLAALPVTFGGFNLECNDSKVTLRWKTLQEMNSSHFVIERSNNTQWVSLGRLTAAGNSAGEINYEFIDNNPTENALYRIAQYDIDGHVKYTNILIADCSTIEVFKVWPNPFSHSFTIRLKANINKTAQLRVIDAKGTTIYTRQLILLNGLNQFDINLENASKGMYLLTVELDEGRIIKSTRIIKQ